MDIKKVYIEDGWVNTLSSKGWSSFFRYPKKFKVGDEVLVSGSHMYGLENVIHTIVGVAYTASDGDIVYKVRIPDNNRLALFSSTYLIKPRALKRIISLYCDRQ